MELKDSAEEAAFRAEVRAWLDATLPTLPAHPPRDDWAARRQFDTDWQKRLYEAGYAGINWPAEYGGRGATPAEQLVFLEEMAATSAPNVGVNFVGLLHAGPTVMMEGTDEQKARYLPKILQGEEVWCQGFSEPSAGSDLASLRTRAVRDGDHYVVSGSKIWTSFAQVAERAEMLVRTDPEAGKHKGISWLVMDMDSPGIEVRPLRTALGSSEFSELFLDEVRIPAANLIGPEHDGWRVAMVTFSFERGTSLVGEMLETRRLVEELRPLAVGAGYGRDYGRIVAELDGVWALTRRAISEAGAHGVPGPSASVGKLAYTEVIQRAGDLALKSLDAGALSLDNVYVEERLRVLALTVAAGTSQIQRNIIGERILGLPR
ncbi:MAG TPA: acyl-CoA dehydrogenase family protein [Acidimicrobiales bacterium]|nr:acyl-CoA dehydrogenase family protein [Acidimicrobiales bacterium]